MSPRRGPQIDRAWSGEFPTRDRPMRSCDRACWVVRRPGLLPDPPLVVWIQRGRYDDQGVARLDAHGEPSAVECDDWGARELLGTLRGIHVRNLAPKVPAKGRTR